MNETQRPVRQQSSLPTKFAAGDHLEHDNDADDRIGAFVETYFKIIF